MFVRVRVYMHICVRAHAYVSLYLVCTGVDFVLREFTVDEEKVTLKVWDTAGTERLVAS